MRSVKLVRSCVGRLEVRWLAAAASASQSADAWRPERLFPPDLASRRALLDYLVSKDALLARLPLPRPRPKPNAQSQELPKAQPDEAPPRRDHLYVLNKPYGVSVHGARHAQLLWKAEEGHEAATERRWERERDAGDVTVAAVLPDLAADFAEPLLAPFLAPPRYFSGPLCLLPSTAAQRRLHTVYKANRGLPRGQLRLLCLCQGLLDAKEAQGHFFYETEVVRGVLQTLVHTGDPSAVSKRSRLLKRVRRSFVSHRVLGESVGVSLVELQCHSFSAELPRAYLASLGAPVVGDWAYGRRVGRVLGESVLLEPRQLAEDAVPFAPPELMGQLGVAERDFRRLPFLGHLGCLDVPGGLGKGRRLTIAAPLPAHFAAALERLGLLDALQPQEEPPA